MGMSKKLNVVGFYTFLAVFAMFVPSVEDLVSKNTCDWICNAELESGDIDSKELEGKISQGGLIKLEISYKRRVDPSCGSAKQTLDLNNKTGDAELWFKMAPTSIGKIVFLSSTILGEIFTGRIFFKSSNAMNVSCIFKPITRPTTNHSSPFAFHAAQSVMYFVKETVVNYSKRDDNFLTLIIIRMENQTHISLTFDVSRLETSNSQDDSPYVDSKLTVNDTWLVVSVLISIIIVLFSPAILLQFRPSKVTVQLTQNTRENNEGARSPVHSDHVNDERLNPPIQVQDDDVEESCESVREYGSNVSPYGITETLDNEHSTPMDTQSEMVGAPQRTSISNRFRKTDSKRANVDYLKTIRLNKIASTSDDVEETRTSENSKSRCSSSRRPELISVSNTDIDEASSERATSVPNASVESLTSENSDSRCVSPRVSPSEIAGSDDGKVENDSSTSATVVDIPETSDHRSSRMEDQIVSNEGNGNCISMIIVGRPSPVSIGSWIGNKLSLSSNGNQCDKLKMLVKFIIISFLPILLLTGFGDLLLILLNIDQEIALDLPNHYLTSLVFKVGHPGLIFLAAFSFVCYAVRVLFVYGRISERSPIWKSCFVHSRHPLVFHRFICLFWSCNECKNSPSECPKQLEVSDNILHNLEELPGIFIKYWSFLCHCFVEYMGTIANKRNLRVKIILIILVIFVMAMLAIFWPLLLLVLSLIVLFLLLFTPLVDILLSSPLVCLCHGRMRAFKDKRLLEFFLTFFSLIWLAFYSVRGAVVVEIACAGFLNMLNNHPKKLLQSVIVVALVCHYVFSSYRCLTAQYLELVKELFNSYSKKFLKELEEKGEVSKLPNFEQGNHKELIPTELFKCACEHELIKIPVINRVAVMLLKIVAIFLLFRFVYPLIHLQRSDSALIGATVVTLFMAYIPFNNYINKETPKFNERCIDTVVDEYIKKQQ